MSLLARKDRFGRARRAVGWSVAATLGASLALACASIIGIDDRLPEEVVVVPDASAEAAPPAEPCPPAARCVNVPEGWELASLNTDKRPGCADGYGSPEELAVVTDGLGCSCNCTETSPGSCAAAAATTSLRDFPAAGCATSTATFQLNGLDGNCANATITTAPYVRVPTPEPSRPTCAAASAPTRLRNGQVCAARGATCNDGGLCAGALPPDERLCVMKAGDVECPAGYEKKFQAGTGAGADTRQCGTCTCTPGTDCEAPTVELFTGAACTKSSFTVPADGVCTAADGGTTYASYRFTGTAPGCKPSPAPLLDGGVTMEGRRTVCCVPSN